MLKVETGRSRRYICIQYNYGIDIELYIYQPHPDTVHLENIYKFLTLAPFKRTVPRFHIPQRVGLHVADLVREAIAVHVSSSENGNFHNFHNSQIFTWDHLPGS